MSHGSVSVCSTSLCLVVVCLLHEAAAPVTSLWAVVSDAEDASLRQPVQVGRLISWCCVISTDRPEEQPH